MPPKAKAKAAPRAGKVRTIYDDLPMDLRATAKDVDRIQAIRGPGKILVALGNLNNALRKFAGK
jgi:hypothetical protein